MVRSIQRKSMRNEKVSCSYEFIENETLYNYLVDPVGSGIWVLKYSYNQNNDFINEINEIIKKEEGEDFSSQSELTKYSSIFTKILK